MKKLYAVVIPALNGKKLIKDEKLFVYIDSSFVNYGEKGDKTKKQSVEVLEMTENGTFKDIFTNPQKQCLTQEQIIYFCKNHKDKLRDDGYTTLFLFRSNSELFVACVGVRSDGLSVYVYRFEDERVWYADHRPRVVVPQLADTLNPKHFNTSTMNPLQQSNIELLGKIGLADTARKINELAREFNKFRKMNCLDDEIKDNRINEMSVEDIANIIWDADTRFDAEKILKDYLKKND